LLASSTRNLKQSRLFSSFLVLHCF